MKKADLKVYKERLLALRARLRGDVMALADAALNKIGAESENDRFSPPSHLGEDEAINFDQEFTFNRMAAEEGTLEAIESALERIEEETYGQCADCTGKIPKARLNALPFTPYCVKCASKKEGY